MTSNELERLIAERFGVPPIQVAVRGHAPDWTASLIAKRLGKVRQPCANRLGMRSDTRRSSSLVGDLRRHTI